MTRFRFVRAISGAISGAKPAARAGALLAGGLLVAFTAGSPAAAADDAALALTIRDHHFFPADLEIPAGEKRMLVIENQDPTVEEFESHDLHREKIVPPNSKINLFIGPLKPGRYQFIGEYNEASAKGVVIAK